MGLFLLFGFYSLLAQVLLLREVSQVFGAQELSLAAALSFWLLWTAGGVRLGSGAARRLPFAAAALLFPAAAALNLLLARLAPAFLPALSRPGLFTILAGSALLCLPAALANGWAAGVALAGRPAFFYAAESAGSAAAGLLSVAYYHWLPGLDPAIVLAATVPPLAAACALSRPVSRRRAAAAVLCVLVSAGSAALAPRCYRLKPPAQRPELVMNTEGSRLAAVKNGGLSFYEDGRLLHAPEDPAPEELVHIPLLSLRPRRVLMHGGGAFFALPEVLKHKPFEIDIAEPDRFLAAALEKLTGAAAGKFTLLNEDPRAIKGKNGYYSAIINAGSAPENAAQNRFYTLEYFRKAASLLAPGGALVFQLPFAANYVPPEQAYGAACVLAAARKVFTHIAILPGSKLTVIASYAPVHLDQAALTAAYSDRALKTRTVVPSAFPFLLDPYRLAWAAAAIGAVRSPPLNTDLNPLAYFRFWRAWLSMVMTPSSLLGLAGLVLAALAAGLKLGRTLRFSPEERTGEAFLIGFWGLAFETAVLLAFQSETGRLSPELGEMFALFMAGAAAGAWAALRAGRRLIPVFEVTAALLALLAALRPELAQYTWGARALILSGGAVSGAFFAAAAGATGPQVYSWDLIGGAAGGLATAAFAAPMTGIAGTMYLAAASAGAALAGYFFSLKASTVKE